MAATPTELLAVDTQRLEESNQRVAARMENLEKEFVGFRSRINTIVAILAGVTVVVMGAAGMIWTGVSSLQRELGRTEATITNLDKRFDELRLIGDKLSKVSEELARLQGRLDRDGASPPSKGQ
jgi:hypothetical protein